MPEALLIVDDEENILRSIERMLIDQEVRVLTARSGEDALRLIRSEDVSVILSDHRMPGMKGIDLLSIAKRQNPDTIRILMTGHADMDTAIEAINKGEVFRFVAKPWDDASLREVLREAIERHRIVRKLRKGDEPSLASIGQAIELKDPYTRGHCQRVAEYSLWIAEAAGLPMDLKVQIKHGSWLHDCGKIGVGESILNKREALTEEEFEIVKNHPSWGAEIARQAELSETIVNIILYHHERYDGQGYPFHMVGDEIPLEARIVTVADVFDAITTDRPYRQGFDFHEGVEHMIRKLRGKHLDPDLVDLFAPLVQGVTSRRVRYSNGHCGT